MDELPCGCIRGVRLCSEAEELWEETGRAYKRAKSGRGTWEEYHKAVGKYEKHFEAGRKGLQALPGSVTPAVGAEGVPPSPKPAPPPDR